MTRTTPDPAPERIKAFPIAWVTTGRRLLIIGGGHETVNRVETALRFDWAEIRVILPAESAAVRDLGERDPRVRIERRPAAEGDVAAADLVVKDTTPDTASADIARWCKLHRVPLNATDDPPFCDFHYVSLLLLPPLAVSVSTGGESPAIAAALRLRLAKLIGPGWAEAARLLADTRRGLPPGHDRMNLLRSLGNNLPFLDCVEANDAAGMKAALARALGLFIPDAPAAHPPASLAHSPAPEAKATGLVALIGCPADPGLLSRRAEQYLRQADVVFHDRLIPAEIIRLAGDRACPVGKAGGHVSMPQAEIHRLLLRSARAGRLVARLHGGDPGIFGHLSDELEFLCGHGVPVDVVPAPTAAQVCSARARAALTDRRGGHRVTFLSAHAADGKAPPVPPAPGSGTLAVYMGVAEMRKARNALVAAGWPAGTPVVVGERLGEREERLVFTRLDAVDRIEVEPPAVFLVGTRSFPSVRSTLFVGEHPEAFLRHGPFIHWPMDREAPPRLPDRPVDRVLFESPRDVAAYFERYPSERQARRRWLAADEPTRRALGDAGLLDPSGICVVAIPWTP
jgi:uroporphyrin-III C-methyltransferase/precorrin-2 dehydrogenase/sirohydrochlorin ferrochelatase